MVDSYHTPFTDYRKLFIHLKDLLSKCAEQIIEFGGESTYKSFRNPIEVSTRNLERAINGTPNEEPTKKAYYNLIYHIPACILARQKILLNQLCERGLDRLIGTLTTTLSAYVRAPFSNIAKNINCIIYALQSARQTLDRINGVCAKEIMLQSEVVIISPTKRSRGRKCGYPCRHAISYLEAIPENAELNLNIVEPIFESETTIARGRSTKAGGGPSSKSPKLGRNTKSLEGERNTNLLESDENKKLSDGGRSRKSLENRKSTKLSDAAQSSTVLESRCGTNSPEGGQDNILLERERSIKSLMTDENKKLSDDGRSTKSLENEISIKSLENDGLPKLSDGLRSTVLLESKSSKSPEPPGERNNISLERESGINSQMSDISKQISLGARISKSLESHKTTQLSNGVQSAKGLESEPIIKALESKKTTNLSDAGQSSKTLERERSTKSLQCDRNKKLYPKRKTKKNVTLKSIKMKHKEKKRKTPLSGCSIKCCPRIKNVNANKIKKAKPNDKQKSCTCTCSKLSLLLSTLVPEENDDPFTVLKDLLIKSIEAIELGGTMWYKQFQKSIKGSPNILEQPINMSPIQKQLQAETFEEDLQMNLSSHSELLKQTYLLDELCEGDLNALIGKLASAFNLPHPHISNNLQSMTSALQSSQNSLHSFYKSESDKPLSAQDITINNEARHIEDISPCENKLEETEIDYINEQLKQLNGIIVTVGKAEFENPINTEDVYGAAESTSQITTPVPNSGKNNFYFGEQLKYLNDIVVKVEDHKEQTKIFSPKSDNIKREDTASDLKNQTKFDDDKTVAKIRSDSVQHLVKTKKTGGSIIETNEMKRHDCFRLLKKQNAISDTVSERKMQPRPEKAKHTSLNEKKESNQIRKPPNQKIAVSKPPEIKRNYVESLSKQTAILNRALQSRKTKIAEPKVYNVDQTEMYCDCLNPQHFVKDEFAELENPSKIIASKVNEVRLRYLEQSRKKNAIASKISQTKLSQYKPNQIKGDCGEIYLREIWQPLLKSNSLKNRDKIKGDEVPKFAKPDGQTNVAARTPIKIEIKCDEDLKKLNAMVMISEIQEAEVLFLKHRERDVINYSATENPKKIEEESAARHHLETATKCTLYETNKNNDVVEKLKQSLEIAKITKSVESIISCKRTIKSSSTVTNSQEEIVDEKSKKKNIYRYLIAEGEVTKCKEIDRTSPARSRKKKNAKKEENKLKKEIKEKSQKHKDCDERLCLFTYQLSNPKFINLGYTVLPTNEIMHQQDIYKAHFVQENKPRFGPDTSAKYATGIPFSESNKKLGWERVLYPNGQIAIEYHFDKESKIGKYMVYGPGAAGYTVLGVFDTLGYGIVYSQNSSIRLSYSQQGGIFYKFENKNPITWKWSSFSEPIKCNVYQDTSLPILFKPSKRPVKRKVEQNKPISIKTKSRNSTLNKTGSSSKNNLNVDAMHAMIEPITERYDEAAMDIMQKHTIVEPLKRTFKEIPKLVYPLKPIIIHLMGCIRLTIKNQKTIYLEMNVFGLGTRIELGVVLDKTKILKQQLYREDSVLPGVSDISEAMPPTKSKSMLQILRVLAANKIAHKKMFREKWVTTAEAPRHSKPALPIRPRYSLY